MVVLVFVLALDNLIFKDTVRFKVPLTIGIPGDFAFDAEDNTWLADEDGNLFVWDQKGELIHKLGGRGEGPGEFDIGSQRLLLTSDKERVIVCDSNKFSYFSLHGTFIRSDFKPSEMRRRFKFFARVPNGFFISYKQYSGDSALGKLMCRVVLTDDDFFIQAAMREERDWTWSKTSSGGWHWQPYAPRFEMTVNSKGIFLARSDNNTINFYDFEGGFLHDFQVKLPPSKVNTDDVTTYRNLFSRGNRSANDKISFPEYDALIDQLISLEDDLIVVYQYKLSTGLHRGIVVDANDGSVKAKVLTYLGSNGRLMADKGKLLAVRTSEIGGFDIKRVTPIFVKEESDDPEP